MFKTIIILYALNFWEIEGTTNRGRSFPHWLASMLNSTNALEVFQVSAYSTALLQLYSAEHDSFLPLLWFNWWFPHNFSENQGFPQTVPTLCLPATSLSESAQDGAAPSKHLLGAVDPGMQTLRRVGHDQVLGRQVVDQTPLGSEHLKRVYRGGPT
jgi:hypothetical protein